MNATDQIQHIENEMKRLFALPQINEVIVSEFNKQLKRWKFLNNHKERTANPITNAPYGTHLVR